MELKAIGRKVTKFVIAAMGITALLASGSAVAQAVAPVVTYPDAISNIVLTYQVEKDRPAQIGDSFTITADWAVPDSAQSGETFGMALPDELRRTGPFFEIANPEGDVLATCSLTGDSGSQIICTLTTFVDGKDDIGGTMWLQAMASKETTESTVNFEVGTEIIPVTIPGGEGIGPELVGPPVSPTKDAWKTGTDGQIGWTVVVPSTSFSGGQFTLTDNLVPANMTLENHSLIADTLFIRWTEVDASGGIIDNWRPVPAADILVNTFAGGAKTFTLTIGNIPTSPERVYRIMYQSEADGIFLTGDKFSNNATIGTTTVSNTFTYTATGGGTGHASEFGRFAIAKAIDGDAAGLVPTDTKFNVRYTVGSESRDMQVGVGAENAAQSERYVLGSTFVISEVDFPVIAGVNWGAYSITGTNVTDNQDGTFSVTPTTDEPVMLTLTNTAATPAGNLAITKAVTGDGASLLAPDTEFTVGYSYTLEGAEETQAELQVKAGETVGLPADLPVGTQVTLTEAKPGDVDVNATQKVTFQTPEFLFGDVRGESITVEIADAADPIAVTLTNPTVVTEKPIMPIPGVTIVNPPVVPPTVGLPITGSDIAGFVGLGALLIVAGLGVAYARKSIRTRS